MPIQSYYPIVNCWFYLLVIAALAGQAVYTWRFRNMPGAEMASYCQVCKAIWLSSLVLVNMNSSLSDKLFWITILKIAVIVIPYLGILFILQISQQQRLIPPMIKHCINGLLGCLLLAYMFNWNGLIWKDAWLDGQTVVLVRGSGQPVFSEYFFLLGIITTALAMRWIVITAGLRRKQALWCILALSFSWISYGVSTYSGNHNTDAILLGFLLNGMVLTWIYYRWQLYNILPFAQKIVVSNMIDDLVVVDVNSTAEAIFTGLPAEVGAKIAELVKAWPVLAELGDNPVQEFREVVWERPTGAHCYITGTGKQVDWRINICFIIIVTLFATFTPMVRCDANPNTNDSNNFKKIFLNGSWKVKLADDITYSSTRYNDSNWQEVNVPGNTQDQLSLHGEDYMWYRKWTYLPLEKSDLNLGIELGKIISIDETFINGKLIGTDGFADSANMFLGKTRIYQIPEDVLRFGEYNLVAVRVRTVPTDIGGIYEGNIILGDYAELRNELIRTEAPMLAFSAIFIVIGLFSLLFFTRRIRSKEYLFFGLGSIIMGVYTFYISQWRYILGLETKIDVRLYYATAMFVVPVLLRFICELLPKSTQATKVEKLFNLFTKGLLIYQIVIYIFLMLYNKIWLWEYFDETINVFAIILSSSIGILYLLHKLTIKEQETVILFCGCVVGFICGILEAFRQNHPSLPPYMATWGLAVFLISQTATLINRFIRLYEQVEQYSAGLEILVDERTKELKEKSAKISEQEKVLSILTERDRLGRELHDGNGQIWNYIKMELNLARTFLSNGQIEAAREQVDGLIGTVKEMNDDAREHIVSLKKSNNISDDFITHLEDYLEWYEKSNGIATKLIIPVEPIENLLSQARLVQLLRIIQEALTNIRKHAKARQVKVIIQQVGKLLTILIEDDGCGFETADSSRDIKSFGLQIMAERAAEEGGRFRIESKAGEGTRVRVEFSLSNTDGKEGYNENDISR